MSYDAAVVRLLRQEYFYGALLQQMSKVYTDSVPLCEVTIKDRIYLQINPENFDRLKIGEQAALLKHLCLHVIEKHQLRQGDRDPERFNIASDISINQLIQNLPEGNYLPEDFGMKPQLSAEEYYDALAELANESNTPEGDTQGGEQAEGSSHQDEETDVQDEGAGDSPTRDSHESWGADDRAEEAVAEEAVRTAVEEAVDDARQHGHIPAEIQESVERILHSETNWLFMLKTLIATAYKHHKRYTVKREHKRFPDTPGVKKYPLYNILVGLDTSGSISREDIELFAGEIDRLYRWRRAKITVAECDTQIHRVYEYKGKLEEVMGRGGTSFVPIFDLAREMRPDAVIIFTDGWGDFPDFAGRSAKSSSAGTKAGKLGDIVCARTLWLLDDRNANDPPFGRKAYLR
ncbi:MAG: vWA domain-containing protein [bacterium]